MNRLRSTVFVLFAATRSWASDTPEADLPPLFARMPQPAAITPTPSVSLPTSPHIRARLASLAEAVPTPPPVLARAPTPASSDTVSMAPFVVAERAIRVQVAPPKRTFAEALRSGRLWTFSPGKEIVTLGEAGPGGHGRITLGISIDF